MGLLAEHLELLLVETLLEIYLQEHFEIEIKDFDALSVLNGVTDLSQTELGKYAKLHQIGVVTVQFQDVAQVICLGASVFAC